MSANADLVQEVIDANQGKSRNRLPVTEGHACLCGCEQVITTRAKYKPGHDARHASLVARAIAENPRKVKSLLASLPSAALQAKAQRAVDNLAAKAKAQTDKKEAA